MIIDEIKKDNVQAMKDKNTIARTIYGVVVNKYMLQNIEKRKTGGELTGPAKQAYMDYVTREEENIQKSIPQEAKAELEQNGVLTPEEEKKIEETQV